MNSWSAFLATVVVGVVCACGSSAVRLGEAWHQVQFEPSEVMPRPLVIRYERGAWLFNDVLLSRADVLAAIRGAGPLVPRPRVFLRFATSDYGEVYPMTKEIEAAGGCENGGCLFQVLRK
jgi:hypothetical protein